MLTIRLQRTGKNRQPVFRIVLAEKHKSASKKFLEILGIYNPRTKEFSIKDQDRLNYWLGQQIEISPTVHNLLVDKGLKTGSKTKAWQPRKSAEAAAPAAAPAAPAEAKPEEPKAEKTEEATA